MAKDEKFLLVSLEEKKAKKLAEVMSNDTCRKILDFLAQKEGSESEISRALKIPLSTVHYNIKHLVEANLVSADEFHYSEKGKEVLHYRLANKYIIIAPKNTGGVLERLKGLLPATLVVLVTGIILEILYIFNGMSNTFNFQRWGKDALAPSFSEIEADTGIAASQAQKTSIDTSIAPSVGGSVAEDVAQEAIRNVNDEVTRDAAPMIFGDNVSCEISTGISAYPIDGGNHFLTQYAALWLVIGALLVVVSIIAWELIQRRRTRK